MRNQPFDTAHKFIDFFLIYLQTDYQMTTLLVLLKRILNYVSYFIYIYHINASLLSMVNLVPGHPSPHSNFSDSRTYVLSHKFSVDQISIFLLKDEFKF